MRRRSRASSEPVKARRRKAEMPKRRNAPVARGSSSDGREETKVARLSRELQEAREQQAATAEVLSVISASPNELDQVLDSLVRSAVHFCGADDAAIHRLDGQYLRVAAHHGPVPYHGIGHKIGLVRGTVNGRAVLERTPVQVADLQVETEEFPEGSKGAQEMGFRTTLSVPLLREGVALGTINLRRVEAKPFTNKQIALLQTFAAQAVIAIENTRLLNELRESLDRQTATADILRVIAGTPEDSKRALDTIAETASRMFDVAHVNFRRLEGNVLRIVSSAGPTVVKVREALPDLPLEPTDPVVRCFLDNRQSAVEDRRVTLANEHGEIARALRNLPGLPMRSQAFTPLSREGKAIGVMIVNRREVRPFQEHELDLMKGFADQAVIAIENARLLNELRELLQQQTATADVLRVISRSTFDLQTVLNALTELAARLCEADMAAMHRQQGKNYQAIATYGGPPAHREASLGIPFEAGRGSVIGRTVLERKPIQVADVLADPEYAFQEVQQKIGFRTVLGVPLLREGHPIGAVVLMREAVRPFTDKQIELVTTFADQAGIAIENVRLFDEIQDKSRQLEVASQHKSQFLANMSHELRTPLNAILGYTELMADGAYGEPSEKMLGILKRLEANGKHLLGLINDVLDLSKIEAGQLVLELSDYSVQDIAQTVRSTLEPLAADKKLSFKVDVAPKLPPGRGDGRRLTQVLINLVGNAIKFTDVGEVAIKAEANNGSFYVSVRDTGPGISAADQAKLFQEFQQADNAITKKKGGTGLGLAISKRIIEMHGGRIWVELQPGQGSTFTFTLPVVVEHQVEPA